jgi:transketolase
MHTVKPLDEDAVRRALTETAAVITVEEHNVGSGLGAAVAAVVAAHDGVRARFRSFGLPDQLYSRVGDRDYMCEMMGSLRALATATLSQR